jgi:hypothetical protein
MVGMIGCMRYDLLPFSDSEEMLCPMHFVKTVGPSLSEALFHLSQAGMGTGKERQSQCLKSMSGIENDD